MCGIAGFISRSANGESLKWVQRMLPTLARRGPDGEGLQQWPGATLGHRRLAIIDLSDAGSQPMVSEDGAVGLVFNGCIYNFQDVRVELEAKGHHFRSNCDTEVILRGYQQWGIDDLLPRLHGMFAFGIWDSQSGTLFLARDRLGVKPLLYADGPQGIGFASTLTALRAAGFGGDVDPRAVLGFLEYGYVSDTLAILEGITKLPPGHLLQWNRQGTRIKRYWDLPREKSSGIRFEEAVEESERLLVEAVRARLVADVPVGVLLSGGVDSGLICWALTQLNANIRSFTVGVPGHEDDESSAAQETARRLGITNELVTIAEQDEPPLDLLCDVYAEPFASSSALGVLRVSHTVKRHATVLLTGDGGDDVMLGYPFQLNAWKAQRLAERLPSLLTPCWRATEPLLRMVPGGVRPANFLSYVFGGIGAFARVRDGLPMLQQSGVLGARLASLSLAERGMPVTAESARHLMDDLFFFHKEHHFLGEFMTKVDAATMHYSLEARSPMLDSRFWEFGAHLPYDVRFHGGELKAVLREIARRRLGADIASRRKLGFSIPASQWLLTRWRSDLERLREDCLASREGWFSQPNLRRVIDMAIRRQVMPEQIWRIAVFERWLRKQADSNGVGSRLATS